ncbi:calcium-binding protein [Neisseria animaloris]|uniref:calcium-binding protein n=1 Tax=Neisseria animaloris TaxID=326522 RepID=UPI000D2FDE55|nr:calcium-binding protein [Neisseria animaloris]
MMSIKQWLGINGAESRDIDNKEFKSNNGMLKLTGQVSSETDRIEIHVYSPERDKNNKIFEQHSQISPNNINKDGTFSAELNIPSSSSGNVRAELKTFDKQGNVTTTEMTGYLDGNNQKIDIISDSGVIKDNENAWHSYSNNLEIKGQVEPGSKVVRISTGYEKPGHNMKNITQSIDEDGNFSYKLDNLPPGNHVINVASIDADGNLASELFHISVGRKPGGVMMIDEDENVWTAKGKEITGSLFDNLHPDSRAASPRIISFSVAGKHARVGESIDIDDVGTIKIENDRYTFTPLADFTGRVPDIVYHSTTQLAPGIRRSFPREPDYDDSVLSIRVNDTAGNPYEYRLETGDNARGKNAELQGNMGKDVLIGDMRNSAELEINGEKIIYTVKATHDTLEGNNGNDILFGDNISTFGLGFKAEDGSDAFHALKSYVGEHLGSTNDHAVRYFIEENWSRLLDHSSNGGNDTLLGEAGNDILIGGAGDDYLFGGAGKDSYVFVTNSDSGHDTIVNFNFDQDKLVFTELLDKKRHFLEWDQEEHVLSFRGMKDGQTYHNSIKFEGIKSDVTLDDILKVQEVLG